MTLFELSRKYHYKTGSLRRILDDYDITPKDLKSALENDAKIMTIRELAEKYQCSYQKMGTALRE